MSESVLKYTPIEEIPGKVALLRQSFIKGKFHSVDYRLDQLRKLYFAVRDNEQLLKDAIKLDLNKSPEEFEIQELNVTEGELLEIINNLKSWVKPRRAKNINLLFKFSSPKVIKNPLGVVLVIGAFNFPLNLCLQPVVAAIAAGNTVLLKQSELVPNFTSTLTKLLTDALDPEIIQLVDGGVEETTAVLNEKFDKIIYTGGGVVGKIIAKKASETLTPVILELGGKSPVFVTENCDNIELAAKKIALVKNSNAGQICVSSDHVLVHESKYEEFIEAVIKKTQELYGKNAEEDYGKVVNQRAFKRLESILERTEGKIIYQNGEPNSETRFFPSTIVRDVTFQDSLMEGEIFGPILPIIKYSNLDEAISNVTKYHDTPLALYIFSSNKTEQEHIISNIRSGAVLVNEVLFHAGISALPFGGVGQSGYGNYHGIYGFDSFSHDRAYLNQPNWTAVLFESSFPPISKLDLKLTKYFLVPKENINRKGPVFKSQMIFYLLAITAGAIGSYLGFTRTDNSF